MSASSSKAARFGNLLTAIDKLRGSEQSAAVALVLGQLEELRRINATHGYAAGDNAIDCFYQRLGEVARANDVALEINGRLFALVIYAPLHEGHVLLAANKIAGQAREWIELAQQRVRLDVCMGAALLPAGAGSATDLISRAEAALAGAREAGETITLWKPPPERGHQPGAHPLFDARQAIANGEFRVYFQPKIDLRSNAAVGAEALVRWHGPDGLEAPASFLAELERSHSMAPLLQFVMNTTARETARWVRRLPGISIAVNSTAGDLEAGDFVELIREVLGLWSLGPQLLIVEITETTLMRNPDISIATLYKLRELGVRTAIDDFGTGYSSLAYLKDLPVDELKIDRSFVQNVCSSAAEREIVWTIISLGHAMGMQVVAEGIESEQVARQLAELGCDCGQGYYFGKPVSGREFERRWLNARGGRAAGAI